MRNIILETEDESAKSFLEYLKYERRVGDNTIDSYGQNLISLKRSVNKDLINLTTDDLKEYLNKCDKSAKTKAHYITVFNSFYKYLVLVGKKDTNPAESIVLPKVEKNLPKYLTIEEIDELFNIPLTKPIDYRNKAMLEVLFATGMRISELINLELSQVNFDECVIRVFGKGKKERIVPLGNTALKSLYTYIYDYRKFLVKDPNNYIFLNRNGEKISRQGFFKILKKLCDKSGIDKEISPHVLRHSFATYMLNNGVDLRVIQELLGHENLSTTELYSHISREKIKDDYQNHPHSNIS